MKKLCREVWVEVNLDAIKKICARLAAYSEKEQNYGCRKSECLWTNGFGGSCTPCT